jgi:subtilisin family serine protease
MTGPITPSRGRRAAVAAAAAGCLALGTALAVPASAASTSDPLVGAQFGVDQVRAPAAWTTSTGDGTVIGVVDSGVDFDHPDLDGKLLSGATFLACGSSGSCGNGDWESGPAERKDSKSTHGTHVAGIAAAETDNGVGIAGVAPDAKILPVKALDRRGGSFADIAAGITYAVDHGADVINLSLGAIPGAQALTFTGLISDVQDAITYARDNGVVVVAAAGNSFMFPLCGTPAFDDGAVCVTSTDKREAPAAYSNMGLKPDFASVAAPGGSLLPICGEDVVSTVPLGTGRAEVCGYGTDYDEYAGTSMATPHVAGVAALLAAQGRTDDNIVDVLLSTSRQPRTDVRGVFTPQYGWGIVDAEAAVAAAGATAGSDDGGSGDTGSGGDSDKGNNGKRPDNDNGGGNGKKPS